MKNIASILLLILLVSCKDPCKNVNCNNGICNEGTCICSSGWGGPNCDVEECTIDCFNGTCVNNVCNCSAGYEGFDCGRRQSEKFVGNFDGVESCTTGGDSYSVTVTQAGPELMTIYFSNIYNIPTNVSATVAVNGYNFTIPSQAIGTGTISGSGSINVDEDTITVNYSITIGTSTDNCTLTLLRI